MELTQTQLADWRRDGWLRLPAAIPPELRRDVAAWVEELEGWARTGGPALHHFEQTESGPALARTERFADDHRPLGDFVRGGVIADVLRQLLGEPAVLFKEKVNYKQPGGAGFAPHQDATAYRFVDHHISVMVPVDPGTVASGCLYFAPGHQQGRMETDDRGRVAEAVVRTLDWRAVEVDAGDLVFFDSYAPHHSGTNTTARARRALYLTYNAVSAGDFREAYYRDKEGEFARGGGTFGGERVRISISDDFLGRPVEVVPDGR
jgi:hypothetical protein